MKKNLMSFGVMMAAIFTLSSCVKEFADNTQNNNSERVPFEFSASIETKTANDGMATNWVAEDAVNLFHAQTGTASYVNDGAFTISEENVEAGIFRGELAEGLAEGQAYDWYALYPYSEALSTPANTSAALVLGAASDAAQTQTGNDNMAHIAGAAYPIYGTAKEVAVGSRLSLGMKHASALVEVVVKNTVAASVTVSSVALTAQEDIVGTYYINIAGDAPVFTAKEASTSNTAVLNVTEAAAIAKGAEAKYYFAVKPFTAAAGTKLSLKVNGYEKEITLDKAVSFNAGKIRTLNFDFNTISIPVVTASKVAFSSATLTWAADGTAESYNIYVNDNKVGSVAGNVGTYALTGLATGAESTVAVEAVSGDKTAKSAEVNVKTAGVYEVENNTGTSFLCIGWDELARTEVNGEKQAYQVQVYEDAAGSKLIYDITPYGGENNHDNYVFGNSSYLGAATGQKQGLEQNLTNANVITPMRLSVGGFYPNTTYYVRVRTLESYRNYFTYTSEGKTVTVDKTITHAFGTSEWSALVPMTTDAEHVLADNEIIYGGFNDMCVQTDFLSPALGAKNNTSSAAIAWDKRPVDQFFRFYSFGHGLHQADTYKLATVGQRIDESKVLANATNCAIHVGNAKGTGNTYIGDMTGWVWAMWTRPCMGAFALDGVERFIATPALTSDKLSSDGTDCTLTFKAAIRTRRQDNPVITTDALEVKVWRASTKAYESIAVFKTSEILPYDNATATATNAVNDYGRNTLTCDLTLHPGDNVEIVAKRSGYIILDDILIVKK